MYVLRESINVILILVYVSEDHGKRVQVLQNQRTSLILKMKSLMETVEMAMIMKKSSKII